MTAPNTNPPAAPPSTPITVLPSGNTQGDPASVQRPGETAIERATREAQSRVASGQPIVPGTPATPAAPAVPADADRPRNPDGTFAATTPPAGQTPPAGDPATQTPPAPTDPNAAPAGDEADETVEETPEEKQAREAAEAAASERSVTITGRNNEEFVLELPEDTPREVVEAVRHLRNGYMRADEIRAARQEIEQRGEQIATVQAEIELDPAGYLLRVAEQNPVIELDDAEVHVVDHTVLHLLTNPKVWERLSPTLERLVQDENERRIVRAETTAQRSAIREEMRTAQEERAAVSRNLSDVQATIAAMLPTTMSEAQQQVLYRDCLRDVKDFADRNRRITIPVNDIPGILAQRLTAYGVNPVEAAARAAESLARRGPAATRRPAPGAGNGGAPAAPKPSEAPRGGQRFVVSAKKKGEAGAIPPGGAGSPAGASALVPPTKPDGSRMTIQETIDWHRSQVKTGIKRIG